jgi:glycosyltransferase involved in cell wall biosynthesis
MRIVILHNGALIASLRRLGHEVLHIGTTPGCDVVLDQPLSHRRFLDLLATRGWRPDLVLWCDACQPPWMFGLESLPAVVIGYSVDQYMNPWHVPYSAAFDTVFVAQKDYLPLFDQPHFARPSRWLPLYCDQDRDTDPGGPRDIPVAFVGTLESHANPGRKPFLEAFRAQAPLFVTSGRYGPIFGRSRLVLNQSAAGELNFRVFEAMACGAALLTEDAGNGLRDLFRPGRDLFVYRRGDATDAAAQARLALADPDLPTIAGRGREIVLAGHTALHRARDIALTARRLAGSGAPGRRLARLAAVRREVAKAYAFLATDTALPLADDQRQFYLQMAERTDQLTSSSS